MSTNPFNALELKMPPPLMTLLGALGMWLIARSFPDLTLEVPAHFRLAACTGLLLCAGFLEIYGLRAFYRQGTAVTPLQPKAASALVSEGVYRYSRNPMYCGLALLLGAWATYLANPLAFAVLPLFVAAMNRFQIVPEERALEARFGKAYADYRKSVRRWLGRL